MNLTRAQFAAIIGSHQAPDVPVVVTATTVLGSAPLSVTFAAIGGLPDDTTLAMLDTTKFAWDFGDPGSGVWTYGAQTGKSRNERFSPWAGHLYETPGIYKAKLTVTSAYGVVQTRELTITVTDPTLDLPTSKQLYISNGTDFTGVPAGANTLTTSLVIDPAMQTFMTANATTGYRIFYKCGDTYTANSNGGPTNGAIVWIKNGVNVRISSWGTGAKPVVANSWTGSSAVAMFMTGQGAGINIGNDVAISGLDIQQDPANYISCGVRMYATTSSGWDGPYTNRDPASIPTGDYIDFTGRTTVANCSFTHVGAPIIIGGFGAAVVNCTLTNLSGPATSGIVGIFGNTCGGFIAGNDIDRSNTGEHGFRVQGIYRTDIYSNRVRNATSTKHLMAIREFNAGLPTRYNAISNNDLDASTAAAGLSSCLQIAPQNTSVYGLLDYMIVDHNKFTQQPTGTPNILLTSNHLIIRHNYHNQSQTGTTSSATGILLQAAVATPTPTPAASDIIIRNNSSFDGSPTRFSYVQMVTGNNNITLKDNLVYAPACTKDASNNNFQGVLYSATGTQANLVLLNNSTNAQIKNNDPKWQSAAIYSPAGPPYFPAATEDFVLQEGSGSYALTASSTTPPGKIGAILDLSAI